MNIFSLHIKNSFAHKDTFIEFKSGANYLVGQNESGKSEALEMISYALFGSTALRDEVSAYKNLSVVLTFKVLESVYIVSRSAKKVELHSVCTVDDVLKTTLIAVSTKAVNNYIIDLLKVNFDLFTKLNFSRQLDSNFFSTCTKAARLSLINAINGVDEAEAFETYLSKSNKNLKAELKGLNLSETIDSLNFKRNLALDNISINFSDKLSELYDEMSFLKTIIADYKAIPVINKEDLDLYFSLEKDFNEGVFNKLIENFENTQKLLKELTETKVKLVKNIETFSFYKKGTTQLISKQEVDNETAIHSNNALYDQKQQLLAKGFIECPECSSSFPLMTEALKAFSNIEYIQTTYTSAELKKAQDYITHYEKNVYNYLDELQSIESQLNNIKLPNETLVQHSIEKQNFCKKMELSLTHKQNLLNAFNTKYKDILDFDLNMYELNLISKQKEYDKLNLLRDEFEAYSKLKAIYEAAVDSNNKVKALAKERTDLIEAQDNLIAFSKQYKLQVQNNCIPTLNNKASYLISHITGGEHFSLTLSDTFELFMDSKPVSVYSGSAQIAANVAFRIALLEMFYKDLFPVFIGDEVDSYADPDRAQHTQDALKKLVQEGYQVILVSHHKDLNYENCNIIDLNKIKK